MTTEVPRRAALDTTEILEKILACLPPQTLFGVQRVSRQWRDLIARSPPIQEKMFLRRVDRVPEVWMMTPLKPEPEIPSDEMRVLELSECNFRTVSAAEVESGDCESKYGARGTQHLRTPVALNPWLRRRTWLRRSDSYLIEAEVSVKLFALTRFALNSSLMNTYLTDPPCEECEVGMAFKSYHHYILVSATIRSDKPLTLGDVMDRTLVSKTWKLVTEHKPSVGPQRTPLWLRRSTS